VTKFFAEKSVFITGAGSGIGYETALAFAREGATIIGTDINQASLDALKAQIEGIGVTCHAHPLDVADETAYQALVNHLDASNLVPDIVVNNAGIGVIRPFLETTSADWQLTLNVNILGVVLGCRLFSSIWQQRGMPGHLVNISSMAAYTPLGNLSAYVASKYAVEGLSDVLAMELQELDINVSCVHPGVINTAIVHQEEMVSIDPAQLKRLQRHYVEEGVHPRVVADDIVRGVQKKTGTILSGRHVGVIALLKRLLPRKLYRTLLISNGRKIGYLPEKKHA